MQSERQNILYIRCSDGRCRRPNEILGHCVHQIRLPGGILFPELCAKHENMLARPLIEAAIRFAITIMIKLKAPQQVILASHTDCGAAADIGLDIDTVKRKHVSLGRKLQQLYPNIKVTVLHEQHSEDGEHHNGHEPVALEAA